MARAHEALQRISDVVGLSAVIERLLRVEMPRRAHSVQTDWLPGF
jgi:hypothetical protein